MRDEGTRQRNSWHRAQATSTKKHGVQSRWKGTGQLARTGGEEICCEVGQEEKAGAFLLWLWLLPTPPALRAFAP